MEELAKWHVLPKESLQATSDLDVTGLHGKSFGPGTQKPPEVQAQSGAVGHDVRSQTWRGRNLSQHNASQG